MRLRGLALGISCVLVSASVASAQVAEVSSSPETYGSSPVAHTLQAFEFQPFSVTYAGSVESNAMRSRYCTQLPGCFWQAPLSLPAGAIIDSIALDGCDAHPAGSIRIDLHRIGAGESSDTQMAFAETTGPAVPGCSATLLTAIASAHTVNNAAFSYWIEVGGGSSIDLRFQAVRVTYHLQVTGAPATATFTDVPVGHPYHRFVEALVRAGITAGTGPGIYGVNDPLTRGQMAVFLSVALGLHFAP